MTLASMIAVDEDAFICDMAETYHIYDYKSVPVPLLSTLAAGLRDDSRIKMEIGGVKCGPETLLVASLLDVCNMLLWAKTEDASKGRNKPKSIAKKFYVRQEPDHSHDMTPKEYEEIRSRILKGKNNG
jgi:hypothetical protein